MFSLNHILAMIMSLGLIIGLTYIVRRGGRERSVRWLKGIALISLLFDPAYWIWEWQTFGRFHFASTLPLYLCSLFWWLMPVAMFTKPGRLKQTALACVATVSLTSGVFGFVFNYHLNAYPFFSFVPIRSLTYHFLMIWGAVLLWTSGYYQPKAGDQWRSFIPVWLLLIPGLILNQLHGYDYGYTAGGIGTPLEILSSALPKPIFLIILYGALFLLHWLIYYRRLPLIERAKK